MGILITSIISASVIASAKVGKLIAKNRELAEERRKFNESEVGQENIALKAAKRRQKHAEGELRRAKLGIASLKARGEATTEYEAKAVKAENEINAAKEASLVIIDKLNKAKEKQAAAEQKIIDDTKAAADEAQRIRQKELDDELEKIRIKQEADDAVAQRKKDLIQEEIDAKQAAADAIEAIEQRKRAAVDLTLDFTKQTLALATQALNVKSNNDKMRIDKDLQNTLNRIDKELTEEGISAERVKVLEKQKVEAREEADEKVKTLSRKAWQQNKRAKIIGAQIDTAAAVIKALAEIPFPANVVAAIAYGALGTVNTGLIAAQQNPYATGGIVGLNGPEQALMGERGPETVLPADLTALLLDAASNRGTTNNSESNVTNNNSFDVSANDPMELVNAIKRTNGLETFMS